MLPTTVAQPQPYTAASRRETKTLVALGELDAAPAALDEASALGRAVEAPSIEASVLGHRAFLQILRGEYAAAEQDLGESARRLQDQRNPYGAEYLSARGIVRWFLDDLDGARRDFRHGDRLEDVANRAIAAATAGDAPEARRLLEDAGSGDLPPDVAYLRLARCHLALCRARQAQPVRADELRAKVAATLRETVGTSLQHRVGRAMVACALERFDAARSPT